MQHISIEIGSFKITANGDKPEEMIEKTVKAVLELIPPEARSMIVKVCRGMNDATSAESSASPED